MKKIVETNSHMEKIIFSKVSNLSYKAKKRKIKSEINCFFHKVKLYECNGEKCFSTENCFDSKAYAVGNYTSITDWEWDTNEIYFEKSLIGKQFKESINIIIETIESFLINCFPGNTFYINVSVQDGILRNINVRIHLDRGKPYVDSKLWSYNQPVLREILMT